MAMKKGKFKLDVDKPHIDWENSFLKLVPPEFPEDTLFNSKNY